MRRVVGKGQLPNPAGDFYNHLL